MLVGERLLLVNRTEVAGPAPDLVVTLRDRTELEAMTRELDDARSVTRALRFAAHEHANHLQAVSTLIELGAQDDARDLAQRWTRDLLGAGDGGGRDGDLRDRLADPALAALVLDKATDARDRGLALRIGEGTALDAADTGDEQASTDRVTVVGNLLDNALDAALESAHDGRGGGVVELDLHVEDGAVVVRVADDGPGLADPEAAFTPGWSTKQADGGDGRGLGLALVRRVVDRRGGSVEVGAGEDGRGTVFTVRLPDQPTAGSVPGRLPRGQPVADPADRDHRAGGVELAAQRGDVDLERVQALLPARVVGGEAPDVVEQVGPGDDGAVAAGEGREQVELLAPQGHLAARDLDDAARQVDAHRPGLDHRGDDVPGAAAQHGVHARGELVDGEGLDDVVVGAAAQPEHPRLLVAAGGHRDDRHRRPGPQPAAHLDAVEVGQAHVQQHEVGRVGGGLGARDGLERRGAGADGGHAVPRGAQRGRERVADGRAVLDQHDQHGPPRSSTRAQLRGVHVADASRAP